MLVHVNSVYMLSEHRQLYSTSSSMEVRTCRDNEVVLRFLTPSAMIMLGSLLVRLKMIGLQIYTQ